MRDYSRFLDKRYVDERFAFYGTVLSGVPQNRPRWQRGVALVNESIGEALGRVYVAKYFPPESKARMEKLVANLLATYRQSIDQLDWMGPQTKKEAQAKLAKIAPKIGYPTKWRDYSKLEIAHGRPRRQRDARAALRIRPQCREARQADRSRRMVHDAADGERLLQPGA